MNRQVSSCGPLKGEIRVPGDKSISHRAAILGSIAHGITIIHGYASGIDCQSTLQCLRDLGVEVKHIKEEAESMSQHMILIHGKGPSGLQEPQDVLDAGNSGTTIRLMAGVLASSDFFSVITGDASLRRRPMARVIEPLREMGATIFGRGGSKYAPLAIKGAALRPITWNAPVASAQLKSCILLAGLLGGGATVVEPAISRDHTERMLRFFGIQVHESFGGGEHTVSVDGNKEFSGKEIFIPGDISSAAFLLAAAALVPGSSIVVRDVGINPTRAGFLDCLRSMGNEAKYLDERSDGPEPVADIAVSYGQLTGITIEGPAIPGVIDEIPILAVMATQAEGETIIRGAGELRAKESDRIAALASELTKIGGRVRELPDGIVISGKTPIRGGVTCSSHGDHRVAMA
ncbi:MAG TPA: 3-phosphoshikimate 1-carboxyvinyltransferase, partial [Firmicutes bacterium]|nr:3-phosphoshikimate 1-carboxyvinyltransferase [Bacillota bacterium]